MLGLPGIFAGATWPSFGSGCSPARHRRFFRLQARAGDYGETPFETADLEGPFFWERLSQAGKRVAVLDVPLAPLAQIVNGFHLVDWSAHDPASPLPQASPPTLIEELTDRFGNLAPDRCDSIGGTHDGTRELLDGLFARIKNKLAVSLHCLNKDDWDLFVTVFGESHCVGHHGWHLHDPSHREYDPDLASELGNPVKEIYKSLDAAVGELMSEAGDGAVTIIVNGEGIGPVYGVAAVLDEILWRLESQPAISRGQIFRRLKRLWWELPAPLRESPPLALVKRCLHRPLQRSALVPGRRSRRFYAMSNNDSGGAIRINLQGRQTHGCVEPGEDYRRLCGFLREELLALEDPETRELVVKDVYRAADLISGPYLPEMPDLLVDWVQRRPRSVSSPRIGTIAVPAPRGRTGDHLNEGFCLVTGPEVEGGNWTKPRSITDIAPTLGALLDVRLEGLDGEAIPGIAGAV
jgi:predicted AlkP superfamily phosphohydrolase/phosphomutase